MKNRASLIEADIKRALTRKHKKCPTHGNTRVVCQSCARVYCMRCTRFCPRCNAPVTEAPGRREIRVIKQPAYHPPLPPTEPRLRAVQQMLLTFQISGIERHADSGEWMAVFPYRINGYQTAADLAEQVLRHAKDVIEGTPYGSGRLFKPDRWFVSFKLKEVS